jgi:hypothetical protein
VTSRAKAPPNVSVLERWLTEWAKDEGVTAGRLRRRVAVVVVAAMLDDVKDDNGDRRFVVKGGSALEMRFGSKARTSKDLDAIYRGPLTEAVGTVERAVGIGWQGFAGRVVKVETVRVPGLPVQPVRFQVKLTYLAKNFITLPIEVAAPEGHALANVDAVTIAPLDPVGLPVPPNVSCLSIPYQMAQKLHACTDPLDGERPNERARDLADLILLADLLSDHRFPEVRAACVEIFELRARHGWPPTVAAPNSWGRLWELIVEEDGFPVTMLDDAVHQVRTLIERIDTARQR